VALDINGNRELPAVKRCLSHVLARLAPPTVLVKSRALAALLAQQHAARGAA